MRFRLASSPHQHIRRDTGQVMRLVILAMVPGILMQTWFFGWGTIIQVVLAVITAIVTEAVILELRKRDFERALKDYSAVLAAILLAVSIPPFAPWWVIVIGTFFAIGVVKQLYGGLGFNVFNPAMAAYVMLLVSFPVQMTQWLPPVNLANIAMTSWMHCTQFLLISVLRVSRKVRHSACSPYHLSLSNVAA